LYLALAPGFLICELPLSKIGRIGRINRINALTGLIPNLLIVLLTL